MPKKQQTKVKSAATKRSEAKIVEVPYDSVYADYTHIHLLYAGFKFVFSSIVGTQNNKLLIEPQVSVSMSPEHLYQVYKLIGKQLRIYEDKYGPIREEPSE